MTHISMFDGVNVFLQERAIALLSEEAEKKESDILSLRQQQKRKRDDVRREERDLVGVVDVSLKGIGVYDLETKSGGRRNE